MLQKLIFQHFIMAIKAIFCLGLYLFFISCSQDRLLPFVNQSPAQKPIENKEPEIKPISTLPLNQKTFLAKDSINLLRLFKIKPNIIQIRGEQNVPLLTEKGLSINLDYTKLLNIGGKPIYYPYTVTYFEICSIKDLLIHNFSNVNVDKLLGHQISLIFKVNKENQELVPNFSQVEFKFPKSIITQPSSLYYNILSDNRTTWVKDQSNLSIKNTNTSISVFPYQFGYFGLNYEPPFTSDLTSIQLKTAYPPLDKLLKYVIFPDLKSVIRIDGEKSVNLPIGFKAVVLVLGISTEKEYHFYKEEIKIQKDQIVNFEIKPTTPTELIKIINGF
jgi:hypothetical protein